jgi:hypothetical protein
VLATAFRTAPLRSDTRAFGSPFPGTQDGIELQDGYSHPLESNQSRVNRLLLKVTRTEDEGKEPKFEVTAVTRIVANHEFQGLADYQVLLRMHRGSRPAC